MEKNREDSKLFAKFAVAAMAEGKTMQQATDEWYTRQTEAKAEKEITITVRDIWPRSILPANLQF